VKMPIQPNDQLRHAWRRSLQNATGNSPSTIAAKLASLTKFETFTKHRSFLLLREDDIVAFKEHLLSAPNANTGQLLSVSTFDHMLEHCRGFFEWLAQTKEGRKIDTNAVSWLRASRADKERARELIPKPVPSLAEAHAAFAAMPGETLIERRNRAVFACLMLTAIRADALASLTIGSVNLAEKRVLQSGKVVRTKNSKSIVTFFLPFTHSAQTVLEEWIAELSKIGLTSADSLFPRDIDLPHLNAEPHTDDKPWPCWRGSSQVRRIVRMAFAAANVPEYAPHVFRHMFAQHALSLNLSIEELLALSQNLGHKSLTTMLQYYGRPSIK
jgi:site-specific recombinase XerD